MYFARTSLPKQLMLVEGNRILFIPPKEVEGVEQRTAGIVPLVLKTHLWVNYNIFRIYYTCHKHMCGVHTEVNAVCSQRCIFFL